MGQFDTYQIKTSFTLLGQVCQNRYYYRQIDTDISTPEDISNAWLLQVGAAIQDVVSDELVLFETEVINLDDPADFGNQVILGWTGVIAGDVMPPFVAWAFKLNRGDRTFRPGRKAVAGVAEGSVQNGVAIAGIVPDLNIVASAMEDPLVTPVGGSNLIPVLARFVVGVGVTEWTAVTSVGYRQVSSQNSRKFGRGV